MYAVWENSPREFLLVGRGWGLGVGGAGGKKLTEVQCSGGEFLK